MDIEKENILKKDKESEDGNVLYFFDNELYDRKLEEYKNKIDNGDFKFSDTIMNIGLIARRLMQDKEERYRIAGKIIYDILYGSIED